MRRASVSVEFLGLPGAGKSAISRRVGEILSQRGIPVDEPSYRLAHGLSRWSRVLRKLSCILREVLLHPVDSIEGLKSLTRVPHPGSRTFLKMAYNWILVQSLSRRGRRTPGVHLYDQGALQALWSIGFGSGEEAIEVISTDLGEAIPIADVVAIIEAGRETVKHRLASRPEMDSRMDRMGGIDAGVMDRCDRLLLRTRNVLDRRKHIVETLILRNETREDLDAGAAQLAGALESMMAGQVARERA